MIGRFRGWVALLVACCGLLGLAATASAKEVLYAADGAGGNPSNLYILNPSSGAVVQIVGPIGFAVTGLAVDPDSGTLYGSTSLNASGGASNPGWLITIDRATGAGRLIGELEPGTGTANQTAADITFTPDRALFGWLQQTSSDLVTIDKATGAASIVGDSGLSTEGSGLASSPAGVLFLTESGANGPLDIVDRNTGAATPVATMNGPGVRVSALAFDLGGTLFGAQTEGSPTFASSLITVDTTTGAVASRGPSVSRLDAIAFAKTTRTLTFRATKVKAKRARSAAVLAVRKGNKARFSGGLTAPQDVTGCQSNQAVEVQRRMPKQTIFTTFARVQTDAAGKFAIKKKIRKTFLYQAVVGETAACYDATSNSKKIRAKKKPKK